jgi:glycosyltransferase involved in cell wall biosynthesis
MRPKVPLTVVVPCYNGARYLAECLDSILSQSAPVERVIVVDDASTDGSAAVARRFKAEVIELRENRGTGNAERVGFVEARTELVCSIAADDYWDREHCEVVYGLIRRHPEAALACSACRFVGSRTGLWRPPFEEEGVKEVFWESLWSTCIPVLGAMIKKRALIDAGALDRSERFCSDYDRFLRLSHRYPVAGTPVPTTSYRWHPHGQLGDRRERQLRAMREHRNRFIREVALAGDAGAAIKMKGRILARALRPAGGLSLLQRLRWAC